MKTNETNIKNSLLFPMLIAVLNLIPAGRMTAQPFTTLHGFTALGVYPYQTNSDGVTPYAGLITNSSGNTLYGTAAGGGSSGYGTVFAVSTDGTGFTNLYSFTAGAASFPYTNSDGRNPQAELILSGNTLFGTAAGGGSSGYGTVFAVNTNGTGFTNLHSFTRGSDGANPQGLILSGNTLYGTASGGGSFDRGTVFALNTDGTGFTTLHSFTAIVDPYYTNSDGSNPYAGLILSGNTLYGTAGQGGSSGAGAVFAVKTDGTGFTNLHSFTATSGPFPSTNSDGANLDAGLILSGNTLYGTANYGGSSNRGTVFALNTDGTGFTTLHGFTGSGGAYPYAGLLLSGDTLYGTAAAGGSSGNGTVFSISFRPQLTISPSGTNVILSWPISYAGFSYAGYTLQSTTNLLSPSAWVTNSPVLVVIAGQNTVTNPISTAQRYYRLVQ
jgi:hypothetical protein